MTGIICLQLMGDHQVFAMEEPGYVFSRIIFRNNGYFIQQISVNKTGIDPEELKKFGVSIFSGID